MRILMNMALAACVMSPILISAQHEDCHSPSATDQFANFSAQAEFREIHLEPLPIDVEFKGEMVEFDTPDGATAKAYAVMAENPTTNYLLVIHEWWGLNDHIKQEADILWEKLGNVNALALDIYDGKVADNREDASVYMKATKKERAEAIIEGAIMHAGPGVNIYTIGWCFGGGWSLQATILAKDKAAGCVLYYGMPEQDTERLKLIQADVLGIFAKQDGWITPEVANTFKSNMQELGKEVEVHIFDAKHAFANPSNPGYNMEAAEQADELTLQFFTERLK